MPKRDTPRLDDGSVHPNSVGGHPNEPGTIRPEGLPETERHLLYRAAMTDDQDSQSDDETYGGVPNEWLADIGRIALTSGRIEFAAYQIAAALDLPQPKNGRTRAFAQQCTLVIDRLDDPWRPEWMDVNDWRARCRIWMRTIPGLMDQHRNGLLHRAYLHQRDPDGWVLKTFKHLGDFDSGIVPTHDEFTTAIEALRPHERVGIELWIDALQLRLAAGLPVPLNPNPTNP